MINGNDTHKMRIYTTSIRTLTPKPPTGPLLTSFRVHVLIQQSVKKSNQPCGRIWNASETDRTTDAWRMEALHDSRRGVGTHLAGTRGRSGKKRSLNFRQNMDSV